MTQLAEALHGELPGPPVQALFVYNSNPAAVCPDQSRVLSGLARDDLFTVVHEQFQTDTADYADILLPATTQLEHFDIHGSYGHLYVQANNAAIAPLGEAKPNTEVFRLLARAMGFEPELFDVSDESLAAGSLGTRKAERGTRNENHEESSLRSALRAPRSALDGITLDAVKKGPVRLNLPAEWAPFADGGFPTPSGKCEFYSAREARAGRDPLPAYVPPHEDPQTRPDLAAKYPLQMLTPPAPSFLNSSFVNVESLRRAAGEVTLEIHPADAARRGIAHGQTVAVFNDRGRFHARAIVGESVKPGVVVSLGSWWTRYTADGANCNTTTSTALTDLGAAATFYDNLVEVAATA